MPSSVLHTVKRSLSLTRKSPPLETTPTYYGMTAEENVFNLSAAPPQQPLRAPPTFQQIASGLALRQPRPRDSKPIADPPRRPSLKKPSNSLLPTPPATAPASASSSFVKLRRFSSSSPTPGSVISSSSSATTSTSSSTSHRHTSNPVMARVTKHKLSLSFSALTGGGRRGASDNTNSSGSLSSLDAAGAKKAVRFTDSPEPTIIPDGVAATSKSQHVRASRQAPTYEVAFPGAPRPNLQHRQTDGTFVEKAASRLFSR